MIRPAMLLAFFLSAGCLTPSFEEAAVAQEWPGPPVGLVFSGKL